jgi:hypothetical protein
MDIEGPHHLRGVGGEVIVKVPSEDSRKFLCAARKLVSLKGLPQEIETKNKEQKNKEQKPARVASKLFGLFHATKTTYT